MDIISERAWNDGAVRSLLAHIEITKEYHSFLASITGGHPAITCALQDAEKAYAWAIKLASGPSSEVAE